MKSYEKPSGGASQTSVRKCLSSPGGEVSPHNLEAEQSVLGAMLITPSVIPQVVERIASEDFYRDSHRLIFRAIVKLGEAADPMTLAEYLRTHGILEKIGGHNYILTLQQLCPVASNASLYADAVKSAALELGAYAIGRELAQGDLSATDAIAKLELLSVSSRTGNSSLPVIQLADVPEPGPMKYRVEKLVPENYPTLFHAAGGIGKSITALYIGVCVATGLPFAGLEVIRGRVLYVDFELSQEEQARRVHQIVRGLGLEKAPSGLDYINPGIQDHVPTSIQKLVPQLTGYDLYIFDSLGAAMQGDMEAAKDIVPFFQMIRSLGTVLILDHQSKVQGGQHYKDKDAFGSVYKTNLSRSVWQLRQTKPDSGAGLLLTLTHKKTNFGPLYDPIGMRATFGHEFRLEAANIPQEPESASDTARDRIKGALHDGPATNKRLAEITGLADSTIRGAISDLQGDGYVHECGKEGRASIWTLIPTVTCYSPMEVTDNTSAEPELVQLKQQGRLAI